MSQDLYEAPDYFLLDELLSDEHKLIRDAAREWVKREVSPIIEESCQKAEFPKQIIKGLAEIGGFGPYIPEKYGGLDFGYTGLGQIIEETGRTLTKSPIISSILLSDIVRPSVPIITFASIPFFICSATHKELVR